MSDGSGSSRSIAVAVLPGMPLSRVSTELRSIAGPTIGPVRGTAMYVGAVLGPGVPTLPALAARRAGPAFLITLVALLALSVAPLAATFAALGRRFPTEGGFSGGVVESTPVECGRSRETQKRSDLAGWAEGSRASHTRYFWGLRLHLVATCTDSALGWALTGAKADERETFTHVVANTPALSARRSGRRIVLADQAYYGRAFESSRAPSGPETRNRWSGPVSRVRQRLHFGGAEGIRTPDLLIARGACCPPPKSGSPDASVGG